MTRTDFPGRREGGPDLPDRPLRGEFGIRVIPGRGPYERVRDVRRGYDEVPAADDAPPPRVAEARRAGR